ncbi:Na/Pi symporter [Defluviimonas sp. WL0024]|uniref:Na/Pi symporter n=1 Tax=Albidovulum salinarum TaxID=2984153 RepID=A0ABT2X9C7_9RHOB|nr:Na/Pi symporter [Defluviimonas sp. WL0024]MCU9850543.1 Na/Pi symporter [Defluviimonas sp. WL0024]
MSGTLQGLVHVFGGLGLFFFALHFLSRNLKMLAGQKLRQRIATLTSTSLSGLLVGAIMITVTQSAAAATFLLVGLVRAGMLTLRQAQPVIIGVAVGAGLTVLFLTVDIQLAVMLLIGISGVFYAYGRTPAMRIASVVIGVGLLFLGLQIMRQGAASLEDQEWFQSAVAATRGQPLLAFLTGAVLTILVQSSVAVTVVMIAFQKAGLFGQIEAVMFVYGANVGSSVLTYVLASGLTGVARQVALYLVGFNFVAAFLLVPLLYFELWAEVPLVLALVQALSADEGTQAALVYLVFNMLPAPFLLLVLGPTARLLARLSPETEVEQRAKPKYIDEKLPNEPGIALSLVELEQTRLIRLLMSALDRLRDTAPGKAFDETLEAFDSLASAISEATGQITAMPSISGETYETLDTIMRIQQNLVTARQAIDGLGGELSHLRRVAPELDFPASVVEGLDTIFHLLSDVANERGAEDLTILKQVTSDEGNGTKSVRNAYLAGDSAVDPTNRVHLLAATNYCERLIWLCGQTGRAYEKLIP